MFTAPTLGRLKESDQSESWTSLARIVNPVPRDMCIHTNKGSNKIFNKLMQGYELDLINENSYHTSLITSNKSLEPTQKARCGVVHL